jgi:hypothetical protein
LDVQGETAALFAGPVAPSVGTARKPILYFHLHQGVRDALVSVSVSVPRDTGRVEEHFPRVTEARPQEVIWKEVRISKGACPSRESSSRDFAACPSGQCEAAELSRYQTPDADCLQYQGHSYNHLFYRTAGQVPLLPIRASATGDEVTVSHAGGPKVTSPLIYLHASEGKVQVLTTPPPSPGETVHVKSLPESGSSAAGGRKALEQAMAEAGLTKPEVEAFERAWFTELFGPIEPVRRQRAAAAPRSESVLLYVLPAALADDVAKVTLSPPPAKLTRFILVRVNL